MKHIEYTTSGVCSRQLVFDLTDDNKITNLHYIGGCDGNLKAIARLCEGLDAKKVCEILKGNLCRDKKTSCADQLAKAIEKALN